MLWPCIVSLPLTLTQSIIPELHYTKVFPAAWYDVAPRDFWADRSVWPSPLGLSLGLAAVVVGQIFMLLYFVYVAIPMGKRTDVAGRKKHDNKMTSGNNDMSVGLFVAIQKEGARSYVLSEGLTTHLTQPEGFVILGSYLIGTWMFGLMPASYYSFAGGINWLHVFLQLMCQEGCQYAMHMIEHTIKGTSTVHIPFTTMKFNISWPFNLYAVSHKPHHVFTNPRLFDAFNGSPADTIIMILIPLFITANLVHVNVWSYMAFGSLYANWLTLIHSEYQHPWDPIFRMIGFGTAADHHVHHKLFKYNYGHLFMYYDYVFGTYRDPSKVEVFNQL